MARWSFCSLSFSFLLLACGGSDGDTTPDGPARIVDGAPAIDGRTLDAGAADVAVDVAQTPDVASDLSPPPPDGPPTPDGPPLGSDRCAQPDQVTLVNGRAHVVGSSWGLRDEFPNLTCGLDQKLSRGQAYYRLALQADQPYAFTVFQESEIYLFSAAANCQEAAIESDCSSEGVTGDVHSQPSTRATSLYFTPQSSGDYLLAIENSTYNDTYEIEIKAIELPTSGTCANAEPLPFVDGKAQAVGSTLGLRDEFPLLRCGESSSLSGPQAYYALDLVGGQPYRLSFSGEPWETYIFPATANCQLAEIEAACASHGATGDYFWLSSGERVSSRTFTPPASGTYIVGVEGNEYRSWLVGFSLEVAPLAPAPNSRCADAEEINLVDDRVTVDSSTLGITDEFPQLSCDVSYPTELVGPQVYYRLAMTQGLVYSLRLAPEFDNAWIYVVPAGAGCDPDAIAAACSSEGATGFAASIPPPQDRNLPPFSLHITPPASGDYLIAVESTGVDYAGSFTLNVEEHTPPENGTCAAAQDLTLVDGKVEVEGTTIGTTEEFIGLTCDGSYVPPTPDGGVPLDGSVPLPSGGPRLAYYQLQLDAAKTYAMTLTAQSFGELWLFSADASCDPAAIAADCSSEGATGGFVRNRTSADGKVSLGFSPPASGSYFVAVGTSWNNDTFELRVEEVTPGTNGRCAQPQTLALVDGKAEVKGNTAGLQNEFQLSCKGDGQDGPQAYYAVAMTQGTTYRIGLAPEFPASLYVFSTLANCNPPAIELDCQLDGYWLTVPASRSGALYFTPPASGSYLIAVDSPDPGLAGAYALSIDELSGHSPPQNERCTTPEPLTLTGSPLVVTGDTSETSRDFTGSELDISCGITDIHYFGGRELYYQVSLQGATTYTVSLDAAFDAALYAFPTNTPCTSGAVDAACRDPARHSDAPGSGVEQIAITPAIDEDWTVAVNSWTWWEGGPFTLTLSWQ